MKATDEIKKSIPADLLSAEEWMVPEEDFAAYMDTVVCPDLARRKKELWLEREPGKKLYCVYYPVENPRGIVLISHGFTETAEKYLEPVWYFTRMGFHTFCIEHCGHGRSYRLSEDPSLVHLNGFGRCVRDLLFTAKQAKKICPGLPMYLYGHSMGGGIAAAALAKRPDLFDKGILNAPMIQPKTGNVPWLTAQGIAHLSCLLGKSADYVAGQKPFSGEERFEDSASVSRARFEYYQKKRDSEPLFQMSAPSYGWLAGAGQLKHYLMTRGWKSLRMPLLVFEAEEEAFVENKAIDRLVHKIRKKGTVRLIKTTGTKHEIYQSGNEILTEYWRMISDFLRK